MQHRYIVSLSLSLLSALCSLLSALCSLLSALCAARFTAARLTFALHTRPLPRHHDQTIPNHTCGACAAKDGGLKKRANAAKEGKKTAGMLGLRLKCAHCDFVVDDSAIVTVKERGRESVVGHPKRENCPKAGEAKCIWAISSSNWKVRD